MLQLPTNGSSFSSVSMFKQINVLEQFSFVNFTIKLTTEILYTLSIQIMLMYIMLYIIYATLKNQNIRVYLSNEWMNKRISEKWWKVCGLYDVAEDVTLWYRLASS